ncbi:MAG: hypothetical protein U0360_00605 [Dehalococcoidia bacterium]
MVLPIDPATLPPVPHTSMAHAVPVADVTADLDGVSTELEERSGDLGRPAPVRLPIPIESVHAPMPAHTLTCRRPIGAPRLVNASGASRDR